MAITVVFDPPLPTDPPATFDSKAFTLLGDLNDWSTQANAVADQINDAQPNVDIVAGNIANINAAVADLPALSAKVSKTGDTMTGPLSVPAGATGTQVPQAQQIPSIVRAMAVGTVSQSGGVPTGAIIEQGSNANGRYVRFADGTQITHTRFTYLTTSIASQSVTLPATFANTDYNCFAQLEGIASGSNAASFVAESLVSTTSAALVKVLTHQASVINYLASNQVCKLICFGRWF